jgi:hypothetical protein
LSAAFERRRFKRGVQALSLDTRWSECAQQDRADEHQRDTRRQHIQLQGKVHGWASQLVALGESLADLGPMPNTPYAALQKDGI